MNIIIYPKILFLWNSKKVTSLAHLFNECSFLESLPDISEWNTENVTDMSYMFNKCSIMKSSPNKLN